MPDDPQERAGSYAVLAAVYLGVVAAIAAALRASGRPLPRRIPAGDVAMMGIATFKLSRLLTRDRVTEFIRAPFTRFDRHGHGPEVIDRPEGAGLRRSIGELLTCPFCTAQWVATALTGAYLLAPRPTRAAAATLAAVAVADLAQYGFSATQDAVAG